MTQEPQTPDPTAPPAGDAADPLVPKSRLDGPIRQAAEWKAKAEEAGAALAKYREAEAKAAEAEALKRGETEKIIAERDKRIAELQAAQVASELRIRRESARAQLIGKGMVDPLAQDGALSRIVADGDFDAAQWVEKLAADHPGSFTVPKAAPKPGVGGTVASTVAGSLEERLQSQDDSVRQAALNEARSKLFRSVTG